MPLPYPSPYCIKTTDLVLGDTTGTPLSGSSGAANKPHKEIQANVDYLDEKINNWIDVREFASIQEAFDSADAGTGRIYKFTSPGYQGFYEITSPINYNGKANFRIEGVRGRDSVWTGTTIKANGALSSILNLTASDFFDIVGMRLDGNGTATDGIRLGLTSGHASNLLIEDVTIQNITGIAISTDAGPGGPMADSVINRPIIETAGTGISISGQAIRIFAGTIAGCTTAGLTFSASSTATFYGTIFTGNAIDIKYTGNDTINGIYFNGCWFENSTTTILKRPDVPSITKACGSLTFVGCNLHALPGADSLLDFTNIEGTHYIIGGHWDSSGKGNVIVPANCTLFIDADFADQLTYTGAGTVVFGNSNSQHKARAYMDATTQAVSGSNWTKVRLNGETFDFTNKFDSITNYRFQPGAKGFYSVSGKIQYDSTEIGKEYLVAIYLSGTLKTSNRSISSLSASTIDVPINDVLEITDTSQYIELFTYHNASTTQDIISGSSVTYFSIHKL